MLGLFKKKQSPSMPELPPPPPPPDFSRPVGDIPQIRASEGLEELPAPPEFPAFESKPSGLELPELPAAPSFEHEEQPEFPEAPTPDLPEAPTPELEGKGQPIRRLALPDELRESVAVEEPTLAEAPEISSPERLEMVRRPVGPAFVSVDEYRSILDNSNRVRSKLMEAEEFVRRLNDIKVEEEHTFEKWRVQLEDIERKLAHVDKVIARAKR